MPQLNLIDVSVKHKTRQGFTEVGRKGANGLFFIKERALVSAVSKESII